MIYAVVTLEKDKFFETCVFLFRMWKAKEKWLQKNCCHKNTQKQFSRHDYILLFVLRFV